jgi:bacterioferritin-associated ferredoxin
MYVCVCFAVTDKEIDAVIDAGAHSVSAVTRACNAGGDCGSCLEAIEERLEDRLEARQLLPVLRPSCPASQ